MSTGCAKHYLRSLGPLPPPSLRRAHDVRYLVLCAQCGSPTDSRHAVPLDGQHYHGRCFIARFGLRALQALPRAACAGLQLADIGLPAARALLRSHAARRNP